MSRSSSSSVQSLAMSEENHHNCADYAELRSNMQNLAKSSGITKALQAFRLMRTAAPGKPTIYDYNSLVNCCLKSENLCSHDLSTLYSEMKTLGLSPNASTFNTFLKGLNLIGESKVALWVTIEMCNHAFTPSFTSLSTLLKKCSDSMELEDAITVLELMMGLNYIPTEPQVILLINRLSKHGMTEKATLVLYKLLDKALFYGFCKKRLFKEASNCLNKMTTNSRFYPNVRTYTTFIKCLCDNGRIQEALSLLGRMEKRGLDPDIVTYNIILRALSNQNMVHEVFDLFQTIYQKELSPDRYTATALSGLLKKGNLGIARTLLHDIFYGGSDMDIAVYNVYYCLFSGFKSKELSYVIECMIKNDIEPNNITFNTILKGFCKGKSMDEALEYFQSIKKPDLVSFNTILSASCKKGDSKMVEKVIDLMKDEGFKLNVVGFTCLMQYYCNVGKLNDCLDVFECMISQGPRPSMVTINSLMIGLCKNQELEAAYRVFCNLESYGLSSDSRTYKILMRAAKIEGNDLLVEELQRKCRGEGVKPNN
ncbi:unnamed protein product [Lactuca saligna]|uniref:PROP1-like PPR domain-containing protein n=1 Tax=Lactuca saligna TaxID=75948 RepID=A0AA35YNM7_LACSI|nr:unnamed protein product [Lactuca saligna]